MDLRTKTLFADTLDKLIAIDKKCDLAFDKTEQLKKAVDTMPLLVPVVGEFSAGKSSLLNKFIGKSILSVNIAPETAVPAELYYSEEEYDEGVRKDGTTERISDVSAIKKDYVCVRRHVNSDFLKSIQPLVLVDMPGFDSPLDTHNEAIFNYLDKGCHYVVLTPVDAGTVSKSMKNQIQNIIDFGKACTFFVSKTDLRSDEEIKQVIEELSSELESIVGERPTVAKLSQQDISLFNTFVKELNPDELFKKQFSDKVKDECYDTKTSLNTKISALKSDKGRNEKAVEELKQGLEKIKTKKERMIEEAKNDSYDSEASAVSNAVGAALNAEMESLVSIAAGAGQDALQEEMINIVQNTVTSKIQATISGVSARFGQELSGEIKNLSDVFNDYNAPDMMQKLQDAATNLFNSAKMNIDAFLQEHQKQKGNNNRLLYTTVTGVLAATTSFLAPVVEAIIIALPTILNFIFSKIQEQNRREQIKSAIIGQIPVIKRQVKEQVAKVLKENSESVISAISEKFDDELSKKQNEIAEAMQSAENDSGIKEKIALYEQSLKETEQLLEKVL